MRKDLKTRLSRRIIFEAGERTSTKSPRKDVTGIFEGGREL